MEIDQLIDSENLITDYEFILNNVNDILYQLLTGSEIHEATNNENRGYIRINIKVSPKKKKKKKTNQRCFVTFTNLSKNKKRR